MAQIPLGWSIKAADFANRCLQRDPKERIGFYEGVEELKYDPWFSDIDW